MPGAYSLSGVTVVTPDKVFTQKSIRVARGKIDRIGGKAKYDLKLEEGLFLFPALINVHDHLRGDYLPRIGPRNGDYYLNWSDWEKDLRSASLVLQERSRIPVKDCYFLGAYKNLFSGVVTVNDHFPHEHNEPFIPILPIRVIREYTLAHECSSFDLKWGDGIEIEHRRAVKRNYPFITHLEEGFDPESQRGIEILEDLGCLDDHDLFIHCLGFSDRDISKVRSAQASVAWCPASNLFMFNVTCKIRRILKAGINVCLGTDSTHTGSINLLEEMRCARSTYRGLYGEDLPARRLVQMVTTNPARAFRMQERIGGIEEGRLADLLLLKPGCDDPYEALAAARMEDIELLIQEGKPILGLPWTEELFRYTGADFSRVSLKGLPRLVRGDPARLLSRVHKAVGFKKVLDYMPLEV